MESSARDNYDRYAYARDNGHLKYLKKSQMCEDYFQGIQWEEKIRRALKNAGRPVMTINKVLSTINTIMGNQLQNRADVTFRPVYNGNSDTADALAKTYLQVMNKHTFDFMESGMFDDGIIRSRGFIDMTMDFSKNLRGDVKLKLWNPDNILIDPDAEDYDPDEWGELFKTKWMTLAEVEKNYGKKAASRLKGRTSSQFPMGYDSIDEGRNSFAQSANGTDTGGRADDKIRFRVIERQFFERRNVPHFVDRTTGDMRPVPPTWEPARVQHVQDQYDWGITIQRADQIRWRATIDDVSVHDKYSPFKHFTAVPYFPYFRRGKTMGMVEHLVNTQEIFNKVVSQELHVLNSSANGGWKIKRDSLQNMDLDELEVRGSQTGLVLELTDIADAEKITPNSTPQGLDRMSFKLDEYMKDVSGVSDSQRGFDRADVAAKAIEAKQAAGSVNLAKPFDNLLMTRKLLARNMLDLFQTYYTEERVMQITGNQLGAEPEEITINQMTAEGDMVNDLTAGTYEVVVSSIPTRESFMESQFSEAMQLREAGVQIPDATLVESSTLSKKAEILEGIQNNPEAAHQAQLAQLELQEKDLANQETQADIQRKGEETELASARAEKTQVDAIKATAEMGGREGDGQQAALAEIELERQKFGVEMAFEREKFQAELALKREEMVMNQRMKRAEANLRFKNEQQRVDDQFAVANKQADNQTKVKDKAEPKPAKKEEK